MRSHVVWKCALVLCLFAAPEGRADWLYHTTLLTGPIAADNPSGAPLTLLGTSGLVHNESFITLATLKPLIEPVAESYSNGDYKIALTIGDLTLNGTLYFTGQLSGTVGPGNTYLVNNTFTGPTTQTLQLGPQVYTVTIGPFDPPALNTVADGVVPADLPGAILAVASVSPPEAPEPSTLALASAALSLFGVRLWRRRAAGARACAA
jgi:hypothetical protein